MSTFKKAIFIIFFMTTLSAKADYPKSENDFAFLPPYCKARIFQKQVDGQDSAQYKVWMKRLGPDFLHVHHHCAGLFTQMLANRITDKHQRNIQLDQAIKEMDYILEHASPKFGLLPKVSFDQGNIYEQMNQPDKAMQAYQKSISFNPKNPQPYIALSNLYIKQKNKNEALATLEQGLKYKPDSKSLIKQLEKLTKEKQ